jgi:hypothetical protein
MIRTLASLSLTLCLTAITPHIQAQQRPAEIKATLTFEKGAANPALDTRHFLLSPEVVFDPKESVIRPARSVLLTDEMGATDYRQTATLKGDTIAKKVFRLDSADINGAELFLYGTAKEIVVNGAKVRTGERLASTGWWRAGVLPYLKPGDNEIVLKDGQLLVEPGRQPGRSFKSRDGGRTWSTQDLTDKGGLQGEYLMRLRLGRQASSGWAMSQVLDLWAAHEHDIPAPRRVLAFHNLDFNRPGGGVEAFIRTGPTPVPDKAWTSWASLHKHQVAAAEQTHRWAQLKFDLDSGVGSGPRVPAAFRLEYQVVPEPGFPADRASRQPPLILGSTPFIYQEPSPRLKLLRERYQLDKVIAPGKTEMEQLMLLRHWVRNQWHTAWGNHPAQWMPPWDSLIILESKDQPDCLTMCTHYAAVFTQCCLALGWNARHCILDHHCTAEVFVNQHNKWVMMDAGNSATRPDCNLHFEKSGVPLSARDLHLAQREGKTAGITVHFTPARLMKEIATLCRPAPKRLPERKDIVPVSELKKYDVCGLENYRRYAFPARNNLLTTLVPGELYQGWSEYFYDGYCWVGDSPDDPKISPEYSRHLDPRREQDVDWKLNNCRIHLARTKDPAELQVTLETHTPNLLRLERQASAKPKLAWEPTPASFTWRLQPGANRLTVRSVNHWEKAGPEATITVTVAMK